MAMRNFWLTADIDGRKTPLAGGARAKDGGMTVEIRQRAKGNSVVAFTIVCREINGELLTRVIAGGKVVAEYRTDR